jgi:diguanylate cyclase (GGDEF)-like protein/PAS domain S-box-containing protein
MLENNSARQRAEEALAASEAELRALFAAMTDVILVYDAQGRYLQIAPTNPALLIKPPAELVGRTVHEVLPPAEADYILQHIRLALEKHQPINVEYSLPIDGAPVRFDGTVSPLGEDKVFWIVRDITERKRAQEALQKQQEELRIILDSIPAWVFYKDQDNRFIRVNSAFSEIMRVPKEELEGRSLFDLYPGEQAEAYWRDDNEVMASGKAKTNIIEPMDTPKGRLWAQTDKIPYRDTRGNIIGIIGFATDITARKQAEEALALERNLLRTLIDNVPDYMYVKDTQSRFVVGNLAIAHSFGKTWPEEIYGKTDFDYHAPELAAQFLADEQAILTSGQPLINREEYVIEPAGNQKWLITSKVPLRDNQGEIVGLVGVGRDITARKRAEEARRLDSQIMANMVDGVYLIRANDGIIVYANPQFERMFGYGPGELIGKHVSIVNASFERSPEETANEIIQALNTSGVWNGEVYNVKKDGTPFWCNASVSTFTHAEYGIVWVSVHQDITERKRAEEALRASEQYARSIIDSSLDMIITVDRDRRIVEFNQAAQGAFGYSHTEVLGQHVSLLYADREECQAVHQTTFEEGKVVREIFNRRKNGEIFPSLLSAAVMRDAKGELIGVVGISRDITERKRMEAELQETNEKLTVWVNQLEEKSREIELLSQMGDLLQSCRNAEEAYKVIARSVRLLFPAESGSLSVLNNSRNLVEMMAAWGESPPRECTFTLDDCWGLRRGRPHVIEGLDSGVICAHVGKDVPASYLCIPMMAQGETLGVLHLRSGLPDVNPTVRRPNGQSEHFPVSKQQLAATVAEHIALSLSSLKLRETLRHQALRDPLTGLFNRRYMEETIERELHRAARNATPLGMIMFDIDHFKEFNDNFGHAAGDAILRDLGAYLEGKIRHEDIACRYGGDEFILVLPECSSETTCERAEELREAIKSLNVRYYNQSLPMVTVSLGVAVFSAHGSTAESLLRKADQALYRAKAEGSDRVLVAN